MITFVLFLLLSISISLVFVQIQRKRNVQELKTRLENIIANNSNDSTRRFLFNLKTIVSYNRERLQQKPIEEIGKDIIGKTISLYRTAVDSISHIVEVITTILYLKGGFLYANN